MYFIVISPLGRLFTQYNVQQVLEMEWHDLYCMLLVNHSLYLMLCLQSSEVSIFSSFFDTFHLAATSSLFIILPILCVWTIADAASIYYTGHKRALDVTSVVQGNTRFFSVLMLTWGMQHVISMLTLSKQQLRHRPPSSEIALSLSLLLH